METEERVEPLELDESVSQPTTDSREPVALIIKFTSWATLVIGLVMLAIGLLAGYSWRSFVDSPVPPEVAEKTTIPAAPNNPDNLGADPPADLVARQQALMETIIAQTRHFKGNPDATVTLVEFSDFQ